MRLSLQGLQGNPDQPGLAGYPKLFPKPLDLVFFFFGNCYSSHNDSYI